VAEDGVDGVASERQVQRRLLAIQRGEDGGAGPLRDYWLALDARDGRPARVGAEIASTEETYEAIVDGRGICLLAAGNAPLITLEGVITRPVRGISPSQLALAWRTTDHRPSSWTMPSLPSGSRTF
jgi:LysR substrate binding domain